MTDSLDTIIRRATKLQRELFDLYKEEAVIRELYESKQHGPNDAERRKVTARRDENQCWIRQTLNKLEEAYCLRF